MQNFDVAIRETAFIGMNNKYPAHLLPAGMFQLLSNCLIDTDRILKRPGTTGSTSMGAQTILGAQAFEPNGGTKLQIALLNGASNAQLYKSSDGTNFVTLGSANLLKDTRMSFLTASNSFFGFNGTDVIDYDGTTLTHNRSGIPKGLFGWWFHNYLFVAGVTGNPNRLYWSDLGAPLTFTNTNFIDINANDGDQIVGLNNFNDSLIVFKNNSIWQIGGFSGSTFNTTTIAGQNTSSTLSGFGAIFHRGIIAAGKYLYYLSFLGGIPQIRALQRTLYGTIIDAGVVSSDIEGTMEGLNLSALSQADSLYDGKYVYFAVPSSNSNINDTVLVFYPGLSTRGPMGEYKSWSTWTGINPGQMFQSTISGRTKIYIADGGTTGKVFLLNGAVSSDNGTPVTMTIQTRNYTGNVAKKTKWSRMFHRHKTGSAGTLQMLARIDDSVDFADQMDMSLQGNSPGLGSGGFTLGTSVLGGAGLFTHTVIFEHLTGYVLGLEFIEATANSCELYDYTILGLLKGYRVTM